MSAADPTHPLADIARPGRHGAPAAAPLRITLPRREIVQVQARRGQAAQVAQAMRDQFGLTLPEAGLSAVAQNVAALWTQPDGWVVTAARSGDGILAASLAAALQGHASVIDQSHGRITIGLDGAASRAVLAKGCRIDLHPREYSPGRVVGTVIAQVNCLLHRIGDGDRFEMIVASTLAEPFFHWLTESAAEYGYEIA